jgi:preprotein translocase subunit YajC
MLRKNGEAIVLCGRGKCCPEVIKVDEDTYEIIDDDGNKIRVKKENLDLIPDAVRVLNGEQLLCG